MPRPKTQRQTVELVGDVGKCGLVGVEIQLEVAVDELKEPLYLEDGALNDTVCRMFSGVYNDMLNPNPVPAVEGGGDVSPAVEEVLAGLDQLPGGVNEELEGVSIPAGVTDIGMDKGPSGVAFHRIHGYCPARGALKDTTVHFYGRSVIMLTKSQERAEQVNLAKVEWNTDGQSRLVNLPHLGLNQPGLEPAAVRAIVSDLIGQVPTLDDIGNQPRLPETGDCIAVMRKRLVGVYHNGIGHRRIPVQHGLAEGQRAQVTHDVFDISDQLTVKNPSAKSEQAILKNRAILVLNFFCKLFDLLSPLDKKIPLSGSYLFLGELEIQQGALGEGR